MFNALSIRKKFYGFGGLMAAVALTIGAIGYWGIVSQADELADVTVTAQALRNHMEGDMMHDALRADVINALHTALTDKSGMAEVRSDLADHVKNFRERLEENKTLDLNDDVKAALASVDGKLDAYIKSAESMVDLADQDSAAAEKQFPAFVTTFEDLETALSNVSDLIGASAQAATESAEHSAARSRNILIV